MAATLTRKKARREALRTSLNEIIGEANGALENADLEQAKLMSLKVRMEASVDGLNEINDEIINSIEPEDVRQDVLASIEVVKPTYEILASIQIRLEKLQVAETLQASNTDTERANSSASSFTRSCRLPKLELPTFKGDVLKWRGFIEQFSSTVDADESLSEINKFIYLKRYLGGQALSYISGLSLSAANYKDAMTLLKGRYGNPQVLISAYMESLLKLDKVRSIRDTESLRKLASDIENCVRNLRSMDVETSTYGSLLIPILKERLPDELVLLIARRFEDEIWTLDKLIEYMNKEIKVSENCSSVLSKSSSSSSSSKSTTWSFLGLSEQTGDRCVFCSLDHASHKCRRVTNVKTRTDILRREGRCFVCLQKGHQKRDCTARYKCRTCNGKHNIAICFGKKERDSRQKEGDRRDRTQRVTEVRQTVVQENRDRDQVEEEPAEVPQHLVMSAKAERESILLQTATAYIQDSIGREGSSSKILFDSGSQRSFITEDLRARLKLKTERQEKVVIKTFGEGDVEKVSKLMDVVKFKVKHKSKSAFAFVEALCVPKICGSVSKVFDSSKYVHLRGLPLADSFSTVSFDCPVGVLVGIDFYHDFFLGKVITGENGGPVASETIVGWVLSGKVKAKASSEDQYCFLNFRCSVESESDRELRESLNRFWEDEEIDRKDCVVHQFEQDIVHTGERYQVKLPFKPDHDTIPDNYQTSEKRLVSLRRKLGKSGLTERYNEVFQEYEKEGIIERVPESEISAEVGKVHYLPHRPVVKEDRETTKIRAVFDASCGINGPSLNECQYSGPNLLSKVFDMLVRFRLNKVAILADIKKAFLNIEVFDEHRDFLRFLWYDFDSGEPDKVVVFRFLRVVMGMTSSPFLLNGTIKHHLEKYLSSDKELVERLLSDFYVDDLVSGVESTEKGRQFFVRVAEMVKEAGLELRKWVTNDPELRKVFIGEDEFDCVKKVLGVEWDVIEDCFVFDFRKFLEMCEDLKLTKRNILSVSASFYDPLGFISPVTARVKFLFQLLCKSKLGWDDEVSSDLKSYWDDFLALLRNIGSLKLQRFVFVSDFERVELCGFSDSSDEVYCAVVYLRFVTAHGVFVNFVCGKTRVAPLKRLGTPRLELLGCLLLSDLISQCRSAFCGRVDISDTLCWSDSEIALCWIKGKEKDWKPWVENRAVKVRKVIERDKWFHVKSEENPSDFPTRPFESYSEIWEKGPRFLLNSSINVEPFECHDETLLVEVMKEKRKSVLESLTLASVIENKSNNSLLSVVDITPFGSLKKVITVVGYVFRFINNVKNKIRKNHSLINMADTLSLEEYQASLTRLVRADQAIIKNDVKFNKMQQSLNLFPDDDGIFRLKGRFGCHLPYEQSYPALINRKGHLGKLIVLDAHERSLHHGVETTLAKVRQKFWIVKGRKYVKDIIRDCTVCKRFNGRTFLSPPTGDLPNTRLESGFAFQNTGLDFCGPLYVKENCCENTTKVYILLLTCATSRALHLELVPDLGNESFLRAVLRFFARKGYPDLVIHDNAKTFKSRDVKHFFLKQGIEQKFILALAPWWGGFYERLVRNVKASLRKVVGNSLLNFEELSTFLCQVEGTLNSRPLTYLNEDDIDEPLTPFHLLHGRNILSQHISTRTFPTHNKRLKHISSLL